jgi:threonine/homoserine/homoserine lactone efflux protein
MPVDPPTLAAFSLTALAIVVSPGPDTILILRYGFTSGHRAAFAAVVGVQLGLLIHTLMSVAGISLLIATSPALFRAVAVAGALYLAWLGIQGFFGPGHFVLGGGPAVASPSRACRDAIITNLLNPKVSFLFLALFPNFVAVGRENVTAQLLTLSGVLVIINVAWQAPLAWLANKTGRWFDRPQVRYAASAVSGLILLSFAALMLYEHLL